MWKLELPYKPGEQVYIATCNHLGHWTVEKCTVSHYIVKGDDKIEVALHEAASFNFRFKMLNEVFPTDAAAKQFIEDITK